jgi:hypothetical protein
VSSALLQPQHGLPALQLLLAGQPGVMPVLRRGALHSSVATRCAQQESDRHQSAQEAQSA